MTSPQGPQDPRQWPAQTGYGPHGQSGYVAAPPSRPASSRTALAVIIVGVAILLVGGAATYFALRPSSTPTAPATSPTPLQALTTFVSGTLTLSQGGFGFGQRGAPCYGVGGYRDIRTGSQVVVTDAASKTIALGVLDDGAVDVDGNCVFPFSLMVPTGEKIYGIEVAHRGRVQYEAASLREPLSLTLG